jgi:hypothetical protein
MTSRLLDGGELTVRPAIWDSDGAPAVMITIAPPGAGAIAALLDPDDAEQLIAELRACIDRAALAAERQAKAPGTVGSA